MRRPTLRTYTSYSLLETSTLANLFLSQLGQRNKATVIFLSGDLGSGKTTFVQALARSLGITEKVISPTFALAKEYNTKHSVFKKVLHIDAYRFESEKEAEVLRLSEWVENRDVLLCVEWGERIQNVLQKDIQVSFLGIDENTKSITW